MPNKNESLDLIIECFKYETKNLTVIVKDSKSYGSF